MKQKMEYIIFKESKNTVINNKEKNNYTIKLSPNVFQIINEVFPNIKILSPDITNTD